MNRKGIILAGGAGSRLYPLTHATSKQLLPLYDKPVIYYPLTTLMLSGITEILVISTPRDTPVIESLLGDGRGFGIKLTYKVQENPNGLPEAFVLAEDFLAGSPLAMVLGDNFYHGQGLSALLEKTSNNTETNTVFCYHVEDPKRFGVAEIDKAGNVLSVEEKPAEPKSNYAITGLYFFDKTVVGKAKNLKPSARGETEIVDLIKAYMSESSLQALKLPRGYAWFDAGTPQSLIDVSNYIQVIQSRQGVIVGSPEEVALNMEFITVEQYKKLVEAMPSSKYRDYLIRVIK